PAAGLAVAGNERIVHYPDIGPDILIGIVVDAADAIEDDMRLIAGGKGILVETDAGRSGQLGYDVIVVQPDLVIVGFRRFGLMTEGAPVAAVRLGCDARVQLQLSHCRHHQEVAQIGMPRAAEMGMTKAYDRLIVVLITRTILVDIRVVFTVELIGDRVRIGAQLYHTEGDRGAGIGMPHALR